MIKKYIAVETALTRAMLRVWRPLAPDIWAPVATALESRNFGAAYDAAHRIDLRPMVKATIEQVKYSLYSAAVFGSTMAAGRKRPVFTSGTYDKTMSRVAHSFGLSIERNVTLNVYRHLVQLIAEAEKAEILVKKASPAGNRYVRDFVDFEAAGDASLQMVSSLHTSRLAVWGFTSEAEYRGVEEYQLNAVLDGRTSPFCRSVHGRRFRVEHARTKVMEALNTDDPNDLRTVHPWPKQSREAIEQFKAMTPDQLRALGYLIPPFHPRCRTLCQLVEPSGKVLYLPPPPEAFVEHVTPEAFSAVGAKIEAAGVEKWNQLLNTSPSSMLTSLTGLTPQELAEKPMGEQKFFQFMADGSLKMRVKAGQVPDLGLVELTQVYDPVVGKLLQAYAELNGAGSNTFMRGLYRRSADLAVTLGAVAYEVGTTGKVGAFVHARMGFLPASDMAWARLATSIELDLAPGGELAELAMDSEVRKVLDQVLRNHDLKGFWALAALPHGERLLEGRTLQLALQVGDAESMARFDAVLP